MTKMRVQCKGSGQQTALSVNAKRATCPVCHHEQDLTGAGRIRKHMRVTTKAKLRKAKGR